MKKTDAEKMEECRMMLSEFFSRCLDTLEVNLHKPGWRNDSVEGLMWKLTEEMAELRLAVKHCDLDLIQREAADVANMCGMIFDRCAAFKKAGEIDND